MCSLNGARALEATKEDQCGLDVQSLHRTGFAPIVNMVGSTWFAPIVNMIALNIVNMVALGLLFTQTPTCSSHGLHRDV